MDIYNKKQNRLNEIKKYVYQFCFLEEID
jgi:hypothetical protein